ncbi:MAG: hypothetical protein MUO70_04215 [Euryarchaeota archaeon]|nr:hypothetical protein [Euryarchaeota archaeon]
MFSDGCASPRDVKTPSRYNGADLLPLLSLMEKDGLITRVERVGIPTE